ncbi:MAG: thioether cross-link-forming SCIFF peptide maturase [Clostridiales bacterium]|nr:thioether cross-link-forming SCIFF peptide maturase [Clostridiales bacterium]
MIHQYKLNGYNIVIDAHSGSIHAVDGLVYDIMSLYEDMSAHEIVEAMLKKYAGDPQITEGEIREALGDIEELKKAGKLFAADRFRSIKDMKNTNTGIKALCLHVSHACNLSCDYCFAGEGRYHGETALMTLEVGKKAIDFLIEHSGKRRNLEVDFFGGEPLLNWDVVKQIVAYAREIEKNKGKNFRFTLTTNGVLIDDDVIDFANREMHNVVLSLDGRREVHDRSRRFLDGRGSYQVILPKFKALVEKRGGKGYYIRGTYTHRNIDFTNDILHMAELGFTELSMEPVVSKEGDPYALTAGDLPELLRQYEKLAGEMLKRKKEGRGFTFYHFMLDLSGGPCIYKRVAGCGSGTEYLAVTPSGDLYPCHQFVGDPAYIMGNLWDGVTNTEKRDVFSGCNVYSRPECRDCWARLYCAGGCAANAYHATGDIAGVYEYGCELFKKRIECAVMMKVAEALSPTP